MSRPGSPWSSRMNQHSTSPRRVVALLAAIAFAVGGLAVTTSTLGGPGRSGTFADVARDGRPLRGDPPLHAARRP